MPLLAVLAVAAAAQPNLAKFVLQPAQVGPGYVAPAARRTVRASATGRSTCAGRRTTRARSSASTGSRSITCGRTRSSKISNELVRYKPGGAAQAMREAARHEATCPKTPIAFEGQPPLTYHLTRHPRLEAPEGLHRRPRPRDRAGQGEARRRDGLRRLPAAGQPAFPASTATRCRASRRRPRRRSSSTRRSRARATCAAARRPAAFRLNEALIARNGC